MTITKSFSTLALALAAFAVPGTAGAADKATPADKSFRAGGAQSGPDTGSLLDPATASPGAGPVARCDELRGEARLRCVDTLDTAVAGGSSSRRTQGAGMAGAAAPRQADRGGYYIDDRGGQDPTY